MVNEADTTITSALMTGREIEESHISVEISTRKISDLVVTEDAKEDEVWSRSRFVTSVDSFIAAPDLSNRIPWCAILTNKASLVIFVAYWASVSFWIFR